MKSDVVTLLREGLTYSEIAARTGLSAATISYHAKKNGLTRGKAPSYNYDSIQQDIDAGMNYKEIHSKHGIANATLTNAVKRGELVLPKTKSSLPIEDLLEEVKERRTGPHERLLIKKRLVEGGVKNECSMCGNSEWMGHKLVLELDHIDGNPRNNTTENFRLLCPNCHSTTDTWRGRNVGK